MYKYLNNGLNEENLQIYFKAGFLIASHHNPIPVSIAR